MNLTSANYFDNLNYFWGFPILLNKTTYEQILLTSLETFDFDWNY